jgi:hypothetical protein
MYASFLTAKSRREDPLHITISQPVIMQAITRAAILSIVVLACQAEDDDSPYVVGQPCFTFSALNCVATQDDEAEEPEFLIGGCGCVDYGRCGLV